MKRSIKVLEIIFWIFTATLLIGLAYTGEHNEEKPERAATTKN